MLPVYTTLRQPAFAAEFKPFELMVEKLDEKHEMRTAMSLPHILMKATSATKAIDP
jgi:hypothetical protein